MRSGPAGPRTATQPMLRCTHLRSRRLPYVILACLAALTSSASSDLTLLQNDGLPMTMLASQNGIREFHFSLKYERIDMRNHKFFRIGKRCDENIAELDRVTFCRCQIPCDPLECPFAADAPSAHEATKALAGAYGPASARPRGMPVGGGCSTRPPATSKAGQVLRNISIRSGISGFCADAVGPSFMQPVTGGVSKTVAIGSRSEERRAPQSHPLKSEFDRGPEHAKPVVHRAPEVD